MPSPNRIGGNPFDAPSPTSEQSTGKNSTHADGALTLEFKRIRKNIAEASDDGFLVTSLVSPISPVVQQSGVDRHRQNNEPGKTRVEQPNRINDGWSQVPGKSSSNRVVRIRHGLQAKPAPSSPIEVAASSTASATWFVKSPELRCQLICAERVKMGTRFHVLLRVTNTGTAAATGVKLHVDLPESVKYCIGRRLVHEIGLLEPGATHVARLTPRSLRAGRFRLRMKAICDAGRQAMSNRQIEIVPAGTKNRRTNAGPSDQRAR